MFQSTAAAFLAAALLLSETAAGAAVPAPDVSARAYVVMDAASGQLLASREPEREMLIASTTKLMTALVVLDRLELAEVVTIRPEWTGTEGSSIYLRAGERCTVETLLYGLLLESGNDAAEALACRTAGGEEAFAALMNQTAAELGCRHTHFVNPSGLDAEGHYSSAEDLALILRRALQNEDFRRIVSCRSITLEGRTFVNHNRLLDCCPGVFGGKTGYTKAAGRSLASCCERDGTTLICVTLDDPNDWADHQALYDWAFSRFTAADTLSNAAFKIPVIGGTQAAVAVRPESGMPLLRSSDSSVSVRYELPGFVYAGIREGQSAGSAVISVDGSRAGYCRLVFAQSVPRDEEQELNRLERLLRWLHLAERNVYGLS